MQTCPTRLKYWTNSSRQIFNILLRVFLFSVAEITKSIRQLLSSLLMFFFCFLLHSFCPRSNWVKLRIESNWKIYVFFPFHAICWYFISFHNIWHFPIFIVSSKKNVYVNFSTAIHHKMLNWHTLEFFATVYSLIKSLHFTWIYVINFLTTFAIRYTKWENINSNRKCNFTRFNIISSWLKFFKYVER